MTDLMTSEMMERLQALIEFPRSRCEEYLSNLLNNLPPDEFNDVVNELLAKVTPEQVRLFGLEMFEKLDRHPNPPDAIVTIDEITEALIRDDNHQHEAILLHIWLNFDKIRQSNQDFEGTERAFDYGLTRKDFDSYR